MIFVPRLQAPEKGNPYYNRKAHGGYSSCIEGNHTGTYPNQKGIDGLTALPNCVGYSFGRFNEVGAYGKFKYAWGGNACDILEKARKSGLVISDKPQVGAMICWSGGSGAGHIANVERVINDNEIVISQSGWSYKGATGFWTATHKKGDGNWTEGGDYSWMKNKYKCQGFILHPDVEGDDTMTQEDFNKMMDNYLSDLANRPISNYAKEAMQDMQSKGYMQGNEKGNLMPQRFLTRQEFAVVLDRILGDMNTTIDCPCMKK